MYRVNVVYMLEYNKKKNEPKTNHYLTNLLSRTITSKNWNNTNSSINIILWSISENMYRVIVIVYMLEYHKRNEPQKTNPYLKNYATPRLSKKTTNPTPSTLFCGQYLMNFKNKSLLENLYATPRLSKKTTNPTPSTLFCGQYLKICTECVVLFIFCPSDSVDSPSCNICTLVRLWRTNEKPLDAVPEKLDWIYWFHITAIAHKRRFIE